MNNKQAIDTFIIYLKVEKKLSENTINNYQRDLTFFDNFLNKQQNISIETIDKNLLNEYVASLYDKQYSKSSISRKISSLRSFFKYLYIKDIIETNPASELLQPKQKHTLPTYLSKEELEIFLATFTNDTLLNKRNSVMVLTMYFTGMRVSELVNLETSQIYFHDNYIKIKGKGNKERQVPINESLKTIIEDYIDKTRVELLNDNDSNYLFINKKGRPITREGFFKIIKKHALLSGLNKNISPHTLRHSFATHLLDNDINLRSVQMLLGHSDISSTQIYTHVNQSKKHQSYSKAHPLEHDK